MGSISERGSGSVAGVKATPTVYVVDDDVSIREALGALLRCVGWQVELFASAREFLGRPPRQGGPAPTCLILDVNLPDLNGLELQTRLSDQIDIPIIFVTGYGDIPMTVRAMRAGAVELLPKPFTDEALLAAVQQGIERSRAVLHHAGQIRELQRRYSMLTTREQEVMALVIEGRLNKQVAGDLGISEITVKAHRGHMMRKMQADSLADLINMAAALRRVASHADSSNRMPTNLTTLADRY